MLKKLPLWAKIFIGMGMGILWGLISVWLGWESFTINWIRTLGQHLSETPQAHCSSLDLRLTGKGYFQSDRYYQALPHWL